MIKRLIILLSIAASISPFLCAQGPRLTVVIVIDQLSNHYLDKLKPHLTGGIKFLADNSTQFANAFYPNGMPGTAPGHAMLSTGTYADYHGIVANKWFTAEGKKIACDDDKTGKARVFKPDGSTYPHGKSARLLMVDNLSDQLMLHSYPHAFNKVWALSLKSRSAITTAGHMGKAVWFDSKTGNYTSSEAYFKELPQWIKEFNCKETVEHHTSFIWKSHFKTLHAYDYAFCSDYRFSLFPHSILDRELVLPPAPHRDYDDLYNKTPLANAQLIRLAEECIKQEASLHPEERFVMWLCLSSLDKIGHEYGPFSKEAIDMIYQMDFQLKHFIQNIYKRFDPQDVLFVLTADHGVAPLPRLVAHEGMSIAYEYSTKRLLAEMNSLIAKKHSIEKLIAFFDEPYFYFDQQKFKPLSHELKQQICADVKQYLASLPGIRCVWTHNELEAVQCTDDPLVINFKRQLYKGRSGDIIYMLSPYSRIDKRLNGASHASPYNYDTQVPLLFYQPGRFKKRTIYKNVYATQIAPTLAALLNVPRPSACTADVLPGIFAL